MSDYDTAIDLDPNNFLAHYNRGQLRMQLGDDNRAISDFDFIIRMEPQNFMAIFNRALLNDRTGNLRAAIRDYTTVIEQFPNFWTGLSYRANAYRRLGMTAKAELDEFRIFKAQMNKRQGVQPRWNKGMRKDVRKRSEIDPEKYNQLVQEDDNSVEHEYNSAYRGQIQNRTVEMAFMPLYGLSYFQYSNGVKSYQAFDHEVEEFNRKENLRRKLYVNCYSVQLDEARSKDFFLFIDSLSARIEAAEDINKEKGLLLLRAVAYGVVQDFETAISDLTAYIQMDGSSVMGYWQRAVCQIMMSNFNASHGVDTEIKMLRAKDDLTSAIALSPRNAYLYYDRANLHAVRKEYANAINDYTKAIELDGNLAEAYYNRGLSRYNNGNKAEGIRDLSRAGELGLYNAYSVIKQLNKAKGQGAEPH